MKNAVLTGILLGGLASAAAAQTEYVWVTNRGTAGTGRVTAYDVLQSPPSTVRGSVSPGGEPYGILGIKAARRVYVSYSESPSRLGRVAVIDSDSFQILNTVPIPGAIELRRMALSRDGNRIYVTGRVAATAEGAVWALGIGTDPVNPGVSLVSQAPGTIGPAEDVTEVAASAVGGSGNGPGKIYYTMPFGTSTLFQQNFVNPPASGPLPLPPNTNFPAGLERAPDDSFVVVGVNETAAGQWKVVQVVTGATDSVFQRVVAAITAPSRIWDVAIEPFGPPFKVHMLGLSSGNYNIFSRNMDVTGFVGAAPVQSGNLQPPNFRTLVLNVSPIESNLYMGIDAPQANVFGRSGSPIPTTAGWNPAPDGGATSEFDPTDFAFMPPPPPPRPALVCPKGGVNQFGTQFTVKGADFVPGSRVDVQGASVPIPLPTVFVDPFTLVAALPGAVDFAENTVIVVNPDGQQARLQSFWAGLNPATTPFSAPLPGIFQGYRMVSFPAYYTKDMLRQAFGSTFGPYNRSLYRVFFWTGNRYAELDELDEEDCDLAGGAFWVLTRSGGTLPLVAIDARSNHTSADVRVIPLRPGWNMISNPFQNGPLVNMVWATVNVTSDPDGWTGSTAADTSPLLSPLFDYVGGSYQTVSTMVAGRGYFVKNLDPGFLYLLVTTTVTKPAAAAAVPSAPAAAGTELPPPPPGAALDADGDSGGCGLGGAEVLLLLLASRVFPPLRRRRRLAG